MKINDLSKDLGVTNKDVISYLKSEGFKVSSHNQNATAEMVDKATEHFSSMEVMNNDVPEDFMPEPEKPAPIRQAKPTRKFAMDEYIVCRSVTPWKLVLTGVDKNIVYTWDYFGAEEMVMYRDLQAWRKKDIITAPKIIIEDADLREAWRQDMTDTYKTLINVEYPEELFDLSDAEFECLLKTASPVTREIIKSTAVSMIRAENYPSLAKIIKIDEVFGTALQDFLSNN